MTLNIVIAGPGAVGQVIGGQLALANHRVTFLGREGSARIPEINGQGIRVDNLRTPEQSFVAQAQAVSDLHGMAPADLVLLTTKTYSNENVLPRLKPVITEDTVLMSLQNGVASAGQLRSLFPESPILGAFCFMGAAVLPTGRVALNSPEKVVVGDLTGEDSAQLAWVVDTFTQAGITIDQSEDIQRDLWVKLLWNVGIFQWCALENKTIGELLRDPALVKKVYETMAEAVEVARVRGVNVSQEDIGEQIIIARHNYAPVTPSLLQDLLAGRALELDSFAGFISGAARQHDIPTPYNDYLLQELTYKSRLASPMESIQWSETIASGIHIGTRSEQQDAVQVKIDDELTIVALADGHGALGKDVSQQAVAHFIEMFQELRTSDMQTSLELAVQATDEKIVAELSEQLRSYLGHGHLDSGATLLALIRHRNDHWLAHVGDSRAYHVSKSKRQVLQLTEDHRWIDANGNVEPYRHNLAMSRSLGHHWEKRFGNINATPDIIKVASFEPGDVIVLSSDGLNVKGSEMLDIVLGSSAAEAQKKLMEASLRTTDQMVQAVKKVRPGRKSPQVDNTTLVVLTSL